MTLAIRLIAGWACLLMVAALPVQAGGLLIMPTRLVLDAAPRTAELRLTNNSTEPATYVLALELRRMGGDGRIAAVERPDARGEVALRMLAVTPETLTLPPGESARIAIIVRPPDDLASGEYRAHLLVRPAAAAGAPTGGGLSLQLTPTVSTAIPIIVRRGTSPPMVGIEGARVVMGTKGATLSFDLTRAGDASAFGDLRVTAPDGRTLALRRGVALYPEIGRRHVSLLLDADEVDAVDIAYLDTAGVRLASARVEP